MTTTRTDRYTAVERQAKTIVNAYVALAAGVRAADLPDYFTEVWQDPMTTHLELIDFALELGVPSDDLELDTPLQVALADELDAYISSPAERMAEVTGRPEISEIPVLH